MKNESLSDVGTALGSALINYFESRFKTIQDGQKAICRKLNDLEDEIKKLKEDK